MKLVRSGCLAVTALLFACGGGGSDGGGGVTNPPPPPSSQTLGSITTSVSSISLAAGNTQTITVTAFDTQNAIISNPGSPSFTSGSAAVAEVDGSGTVLGISQGSTAINVSLTLGSVTRTATVPVTVQGILPSQANVSTTQGDFFSPNKVVIGVGGQVTWTFGATIHNVTFSPATGAPANISDIYSRSEDRRFDRAGNFNYQCTIHAGMSGQVVVR